MAFDKGKNDRVRKRRPVAADVKDSTRAELRSRTASPGVGNALREAYQEALREGVPPEMLDLLGKLG